MTTGSSISYASGFSSSTMASWSATCCEACMGGSVSMRVQFILSEIWVALRRNLSMSISVALVTMVSVLFLGLGVLAQRQVDTMKDYWYDRVQVSIFLCTAKSDLPNCATGSVTQSQRKDIRTPVSYTHLRA